MTRHTIRVKNIFKTNWESDVDFLQLHQIADKFINSSISNNIGNNINALNIGNVFAQNNPLKSLLGPIYYQNTRLFKREADKKPEYKHYHEIEPRLKYIKDVMVDDLQEILFSREFISLDTEKYEALNACMDNIIDDNSMIVNIDIDNIEKYDKECEETERHYILSKKVFLKQTDNKIDYYFDENTPSIIEFKESTVILAHEEDIKDAGSKKSYMAMYHYTKLNVIVNMMINPEESRIVPAIIIYDMDNKPLEVHCYYKNEYITPDLMELLKPNILMEDFKNKDYFSKKDMDFLDMLNI
jgi:hypothetical protein